MNFDNLIHECVQFHFIDAQALAPGTIDTGWVQMAGVGNRAFYLINVGAIPATATLTAVVQKAKDSDGTGVTSLTDHAGTALAATALDENDDNQKILLEHTDEQLGNEFTHVRLLITVANDTIPLSAVMGLTVTDYRPVSQPNINEVVVAHPAVPHTTYS